MSYLEFRRKLSKIAFLKKLYYKIVFPQGIGNVYCNPEIQEVNTYKPRGEESLGDTVRINLLVPTNDKKHVFGGILTALSYYENLAKTLNAKRRIIVTDEMNYESCHPVFDGYHIVKPDSDEDSDRQIVPYTSGSPISFPVAKGDIFVATAWWTAFCIFPVLKWQAKTYGIPVPKLVYLIQDYEPGFYQWSSRYVYAESTYLSSVPVIAVYNTRLLKDYFTSCGYRFFKEYSFEPRLNAKLREFLKPGTVFKKKKQIIVYGRPSVPRNAFELLVAALKIWAQEQPDLSEWNLLSAGEQHTEISLPGGAKLRSVGKLTLEEYAKTMSETYLGVSLMISPHPSYPPLEMSAFGIQTITNSFANKDLTSFSDRIYSLKSCSPRDIADKMLEICRLYQEDQPFEVNYDPNQEYFKDFDDFDRINREIKKDLEL